MLRFSGAGVSHVGLVRAHNEDSAFVGPYVALVADGVGGAAAGEVASATAAYVAAATALPGAGEDRRSWCASRGAARASARRRRRRRPGPRGHGHDADRGGHRRRTGRARARRRLARLPAARRRPAPADHRPHLRPGSSSTTAGSTRRGRRDTRGATSCCARSTARPTRWRRTIRTSSPWTCGRATAAAVQRRAHRPGRGAAGSPRCSGCTTPTPRPRCSPTPRPERRRHRQHHLRRARPGDGPLVVGDGHLLGAVRDTGTWSTPDRRVPAARQRCDGARTDVPLARSAARIGRYARRQASRPRGHRRRPATTGG